MTLNYENYIQNIIKYQSPHKTLKIFYMVGVDKGKLVLINLNKLPEFERFFVLNFAIQQNNPKDTHFLNFLKRNSVKKAIQYNEPQKIKNFWMIP